MANWFIVQLRNFINFEHPTFRNLALVIAAIVTAYIAIKRLKIADKQAATAEAGLNIDRFQKGAAMLGDKSLSVRQAGAVLLAELAKQGVDEFKSTVLQVLSAYMTEHSKSSKIVTPWVKSDKKDVSRDCEVALSYFSRVNALKSETKLVGTVHFLEEVNFHKLKYQPGLNLSKILTFKTDFSSADLSNADLSEAFFLKTDFTECILTDANLAGTRIVKPVGLTCKQLSEAKNVSRELMEQIQKIEESERSDGR